MSVPRTELHDDLRAIIAAGRELSPEDDALLADMFLDRLDRTSVKPASSHSLLPRVMRHRVGAGLLALAVLTGGALVSVQRTSHQGQSVVVQPSGMNMGPVVKMVPVMPPSKPFDAHPVPAPKDVPLQPKG